MNRFVPILVLAACTSAAFAQTAPAKPAAPKAAAPAAAAKPATAKPSTTAAPTAAAPEPWIKLPPGVPRVAHLPVKMPFALRYEEITIGKGAEGETGKLWHLKYTGWRAADGIKFDSWDDHKQPTMGPDGKPVSGPRRKASDGRSCAHRDSPGNGPRDPRLRLRPRRHENRWQTPHLHSLANGLRNARNSRPSRASRVSRQSRHSRQVRPHLRRRACGRDRRAAAAASPDARQSSHASASWRGRATQRRANSKAQGGSPSYARRSFSTIGQCCSVRNHPAVIGACSTHYTCADHAASAAFRRSGETAIEFARGNSSSPFSREGELVSFWSSQNFRVTANWLRVGVRETA